MEHLGVELVASAAQGSLFAPCPRRLVRRPTCDKWPQQIPWVLVP